MGLVLLLAFLSAIAGGLYTQDWKGFAVGLLSGGLFGLWVWVNHVASILFPESFISYASETPAPTQTTNRVVLVITTPGETTKRIHGLSQDEIRQIGECVTSTNPYTFSVQHFKSYFSGKGVDGYALYTKSVRWMKDAGTLAPNAKGGVDVTEKGEYVFESMRDGAWDVLDDYEHPPYPAT